MDHNSWPSASRRIFISQGLAFGATALIARGALAEDKDKPKPKDNAPTKPDAKPAAASDATASGAEIQLPALPYAQNALEPHISSATLALHHGKHHKAYVDKTNELVLGTKLAGKPLEEIVRISAKDKQKPKLFNNSAQAWNHAFYWQSMKPKGGGAPTGVLATRIEKDFGSYEQFKAQFVQTAVDHFSNGWVWLVVAGAKLKIVDTHDAGTPLLGAQKPLAVSDVWEHAYYLDYKNVRKDYATAFVDRLLNWDFVAKNLGV